MAAKMVRDCGESRQGTAPCGHDARCGQRSWQNGNVRNEVAGLVSHVGHVGDAIGVPTVLVQLGYRSPQRCGLGFFDVVCVEHDGLAGAALGYFTGEAQLPGRDHRHRRAFIGVRSHNGWASVVVLLLPKRLAERPNGSPHQFKSGHDRMTDIKKPEAETAKPEATKPVPPPEKPKKVEEIGGPPGPEPTRYGDWQFNG